MWGLSAFDFRTLWSPFFLLLTIAVIIGYLVLIHRFSDRFKDAEFVPIIRQASFICGIILFYLVKVGPLNILSHLTFTGHMITMSISYFMVAPLILLGIPAWLIRPISKDKWFKKLNDLIHPLFVVLLFNVSFSVYHFPVFFDTIMGNYTLHTLVHAFFTVAAFMMWWVVLTPLQEYNRMSDLKKMGYMFLAGFLLTPACALIIFVGKPIYATYTDPIAWAQTMAFCLPGGATQVLSDFGGPDTFATMSTLLDQQLGGVVMKLLQELVYGLVLVRIFKEWYRKESKDDDEPILEEVSPI